MSESQLDTFFRHVASYYAATPCAMDFVWHGGEPLLLGSRFYDEAFRLQDKHLSPVGIEWENSIQTNLSLLGDEQIELLRRFQNVGVSVDIFGDLRVNAGGALSQPQVLKNMQTLLDSKVNFGCIVVLSRQNYKKLPEIFQFFNDVQLSFRLLPIYRTGFLGQQDEFGLTAAEILTALRQAVDLWFELDCLIQMRPIHDYVLNVIRKYSGTLCRMGHYSKKRDESLFIVNTDGSMYSNADAYDSEYCYGNIFQSGIHDLLSSPGYRRTVAERLARMQAVCSCCEYFGPCSGFYVGEATPEQRFQQAGSLTCAVVKPLMEAIESKLIAYEILDPQSRRLDASWCARLNEVDSQAPEY